MSGGYTYNGYTSHALPRACGARLGRIVQELDGGNGKSQGMFLLSCFQTLLNTIKCPETEEMTKSLGKVIYSSDFVVYHVS